jgi:hypothetical protein
MAQPWMFMMMMMMYCRIQVNASRNFNGKELKTNFAKIPNLSTLKISINAPKF